MLPALAFLGNPAFYAGASKILGPLSGLLGGGGGGGGSTTTVTDVSQSVAQNQVTNIGTQSDLADQLAFLLGQSPIVEYPQSTGGAVGNMDSLMSNALGIPSTGAAAKSSGLNLNMILIIGGVIFIGILLIRKYRSK